MGGELGGEWVRIDVRLDGFLVQSIKYLFKEINKVSWDNPSKMSTPLADT